MKRAHVYLVNVGAEECTAMCSLLAALVRSAMVTSDGRASASRCGGREVREGSAGQCRGSPGRTVSVRRVAELYDAVCFCAKMINSVFFQVGSWV